MLLMKNRFVSLGFQSAGPPKRRCAVGQAPCNPSVDTMITPACNPPIPADRSAGFSSGADGLSLFHF